MQQYTGTDTDSNLWEQLQAERMIAADLERRRRQIEFDFWERMYATPAPEGFLKATLGVMVSIYCGDAKD